jgi:hypothetical protein
MTADKQPGEYIVTEDMLRRHTSLNVAYGVCPESETEKMRSISSELDTLELDMRSRPVTTPPDGTAPKEPAHCICSKCSAKSTRCPRSADGVREHDVAIVQVAKAEERERVLNRLTEESYMVPDGKPRRVVNFEDIESLLALKQDQPSQTERTCYGCSEYRIQPDLTFKPYCKAHPEKGEINPDHSPDWCKKETRP